MTGDSGANATTTRDPGGHGISAQTLTALHHWITDHAVITDSGR